MSKNHICLYLVQISVNLSPKLALVWLREEDLQNGWSNDNKAVVPPFLRSLFLQQSILIVSLFRIDYSHAIVTLWSDSLDLLHLSCTISSKVCSTLLA